MVAKDITLDVPDDETTLETPIKIRWTGKARQRISGYNLDFDSDKSDRFVRAASRLKTKIVVESVEEAQAVASEMKNYRSDSRSWMSGNQDGALERVENNLVAAMGRAGYEANYSVANTVSGFDRRSDAAETDEAPDRDVSDVDPGDKLRVEYESVHGDIGNSQSLILVVTDASMGVACYLRDSDRHRYAFDIDGGLAIDLKKDNKHGNLRRIGRVKAVEVIGTPKYATGDDDVSGSDETDAPDALPDGGTDEAPDRDVSDVDNGDKLRVEYERLHGDVGNTQTITLAVTDARYTSIYYLQDAHGQRYGLAVDGVLATQLMVRDNKDGHLRQIGHVVSVTAAGAPGYKWARRLAKQWPAPDKEGVGEGREVADKIVASMGERAQNDEEIRDVVRRRFVQADGKPDWNQLLDYVLERNDYGEYGRCCVVYKGGTCKLPAVGTHGRCSIHARPQPDTDSAIELSKDAAAGIHTALTDVEMAGLAEMVKSTDEQPSIPAKYRDIALTVAREYRDSLAKKEGEAELMDPSDEVLAWVREGIKQLEAHNP